MFHEVLYICDIAELQIRRGTEDNSKMIFIFLSKNIHCDPSNMFCDPSSEPSQRDGSNEGSQNMFYGEILLIIL